MVEQVDLRTGGFENSSWMYGGNRCMTGVPGFIVVVNTQLDSAVEITHENKLEFQYVTWWEQACSSWVWTKLSVTSLRMWFGKCQFHGITWKRWRKLLNVWCWLRYLKRNKLPSELWNRRSLLLSKHNFWCVEQSCKIWMWKKDMDGVPQSSHYIHHDSLSCLCIDL